MRDIHYLHLHIKLVTCGTECWVWNWHRHLLNNTSPTSGKYNSNLASLLFHDFKWQTFIICIYIVNITCGASTWNQSLKLALAPVPQYQPYIVHYKTQVKKHFTGVFLIFKNGTKSCLKMGQGCRGHGKSGISGNLMEFTQKTVKGYWKVIEFRKFGKMSWRVIVFDKQVPHFSTNQHCYVATYEFI